MALIKPQIQQGCIRGYWQRLELLPLAEASVTLVLWRFSQKLSNWLYQGEARKDPLSAAFHQMVIAALHALQCYTPASFVNAVQHGT